MQSIAAIRRFIQAGSQTSRSEPKRQKAARPERNTVTIRPGSLTRAVVALVATAAAATMTACGASDSGGSDAKLTLGLPGIPPVFLGMPAYVAHDAGLYDAQGVDVTLRPFETGVDAAKAVSTGQIDASWSPSTVSLTMMSQDVPLVAIQGLAVIDWVITTTDDSIKNCEDLKGSTINVDAVGGIRYNAVQQMINTCGLTMDDVQTVALPGKVGLEALIADQIQVAVLQTDELAFAGDELKKDMPVVVRMADVVKGTHNMVLIVKKDTLEKKRDALVKLIAGNLMAVDYMKDSANRDKAVQITAKASGLEEERAGIAIDAYLEIDYWADDAGLDRKRIEGTIAAQEAVGNIEKGHAPSYDGVVDMDLADEAMALLKKD
jgi:NitT/TauT family transport system substrate-binding protein